ncbi:MAG: hypothetical protein KAY24_16810 [Candidatus Eisenbacteria sp.]|nr:hypothetical protein [Candidatus Eisenbacteria bacterium]
MADESPLHPGGGIVLSMPRPVPNWSGQILEYLFLLGATLWLGVHGSTALLTIPLLAKSAAPSFEVARLMIWLLEVTLYAATIASVLLLLSTLGMHALGLRPPRTILLQLVFILLMTLAAIGPQLWIVPKLSSLLRMAALSLEGPGLEARNVLAQATAGVGAMGLLHVFSGAVLLSLAVRRAYCYPHDAKPVRDIH